MLNSKIIDITPVVCSPANKAINSDNRDKSKESTPAYTVTLFLKFANGNTNEVTLLIEGDDVVDEETALLKAKDIIQSKIEVHLTKVNKIQEKI